MSDVCALGAGELLVRYASGDLRPSDVVAALTARADRVEPAVGAFAARCDTVAARDAAAADARWATRCARPLEGVPFAVKDVIDTAGVPTTSGSTLFAGRVPGSDAAAVARLRDAGAILFAKTATPEFAFGDAIDGHRAVNPWDPQRWCGGSSSGSAVALAAREVPLALGTDTGGSIRVPASYCGVCGLKPTFGVVPRAGVTRVAASFDTVGPMARDVSDLALVLAALTGAPPPAGASHRPDLRGVTVGRLGGWFTEACDPAVLGAVDEALGVLRGLGAVVRPVEVPHARLAGVVAWVVTVAEFAVARDTDRAARDRFTPAAAARLAAGDAIGAGDYLRAQRARRLLRRELDDVFAAVDVAVSPATPTPALRLAPEPDPLFAAGDRAWLEGIARCLLVANVTGVPAMVVPVGIADGLPVGMQVLAPPGAEASCLRVGCAFQAVTDHHRAEPPVLDQRSESLFD